MGKDTDQPEIATKAEDLVVKTVQDQVYDKLLDQKMFGNIAVTGGAVVAAMAAFGAYKVYKTVKDSAAQEEFTLPHKAEKWEFWKIDGTKLLDAFVRMRKLYITHLGKQPCGINLPVPSFWETHEKTKHMLKEPISRAELLEDYSLGMLRENRNKHHHLDGLAEFITSRIVGSLAFESTGGFWFTEHQRHPYTLFAKEILHWCSTELLVYEFDSPWALEQLRKRLAYIQAAKSITGLIPDRKIKLNADGEVHDHNYPYYTVLQIEKELSFAIKKLENVQKDISCKKTLLSMTHSMNAVARNTVSGLYLMLSPAKTHLPSIQNIIKQDHHEMDEHYATIIHKQIKAFCEGMELQTLSDLQTDIYS